MTRALTRTHLHSSQLIRTLADLAVLETAEPAAALAEKLGLWIDFTDAIALTGVHNANSAPPPAMPSGAQTAAGVSLREEFSRTRAGLEHAITQRGGPGAGRTRAELTLPQLDVPLDDAADYAPFRRYHQAHQRDMETQVRSLRAKVRDQVVKVAPHLKQLAALDAAFDAILRGREGKLLATLPSLLQQRFNHLRAAHGNGLREGQHADNPAQWRRPDGWLSRFCGELQAVLLAELDLRLQPAVGLIEALDNATTQHV